MTFSVALVGAGAIGSWMADALDRAGCKVSLLARGATLRALREQGLRVQQHGETRLSWPRAGSAEELGVHDFVVLTVKAHWLSALAPSLMALIGPATRIVSGTNGIPWWFFHDFGGALQNQSLAAVDPGGAQERAFPRQAALGSVVHAAVRVLAPASVHVVATDRLLIGEPNGVHSTKGQALVDAFRRGGINALASQRIRADLWEKLWGNMNMNPLSALTRSGTGRMLSEPRVRDLCMSMMDEMQACGQRLNLPIDMTVADRIAVTQHLGDFKTSMLCDLEAGRPLELAPQLGAVVEICSRLSVPAPHMAAILGLATLISP